MVSIPAATTYCCITAFLTFYLPVSFCHRSLPVHAFLHHSMYCVSDSWNYSRTTTITTMRVPFCALGLPRTALLQHFLRTCSFLTTIHSPWVWDVALPTLPCRYHTTLIFSATTSFYHLYHSVFLPTTVHTATHLPATSSYSFTHLGSHILLPHHRFTYYTYIFCHTVLSPATMHSAGMVTVCTTCQFFLPVTAYYFGFYIYHRSTCTCHTTIFSTRTLFYSSFPHHLHRPFTAFIPTTPLYHTHTLPLLFCIPSFLLNSTQTGTCTHL